MILMETDNEKAIRLLTEQLNELETVRGLNYKHEEFKAWRDTTSGYFKLFLPPSSPYLDRFQHLYFASRSFRPKPWGSRPNPPGYVSPQDQKYFNMDCGTAEATIKAVLKYIQEFGAHVVHEAPRKTGKKSSPVGRGDVHQNFYGPVTFQNQAIATGNASQNVGHLGDTATTGASLLEIRGFFEESRNLEPRQIREGLVAVDALTLQIHTPERQRNLKSVLNYGQAVLSIADKATDVAHKIAPYLPSVATLVQNARHALGG